MGKLQKQFESKYGFDGVNFVKQAGNEYFGSVKSLGIENILQYYADKKGIDIKVNEPFLQDLIQAMAEAGEKFPENQKVSIELSDSLIVTPINPSVPKSKGVLQDFKDIVSDDELRPVMKGVFVSPDGFLVGTDAHKLVKFKNDEFKKDADKIIDLKVYLGTKGDKIQFIDGKYPNYEGVIPRSNEHKVKDVPLYPFYNLSRSAIALKKLTTASVFNISFLEKGVEFHLNPILLAELLDFALAKSFTKADIEFDSPSRAFLFKFEGENEGLIMPIMKGGLSTKPYTFDQVIQEFSEGGKSKASKPKALPKQGEPKLPKKEQPYKKYEGSLDDVTYIPRRDISMVILKNGEELTNADIIDGVYRLKKKFANGGNVKKGLKVAKKYTKLAVRKSKPIVKKGVKSAKIGFDALAKKVAKAYEGSAVQKKYQTLYGKVYSKKEAQEVGNKVAAKVYRQQQGMK
jgi:DNA polymerase III sliding clamp (beta) subunit (PCNA family)